MLIMHLHPKSVEVCSNFFFFHQIYETGQNEFVILEHLLDDSLVFKVLKT